MSTVRLGGSLREFGPPDRWESSAGTVAALLDDLDAAFPALRLKVRDEAGAVRRSVQLFVNGEDIRNREGTATPLNGSDRVDIVRSIPGG